MPLAATYGALTWKPSQGTKLYCLAHWCEQLAQGRCPTMPRPGIEPTICRSRVRRPNHYTTETPCTMVSCIVATAGSCCMSFCDWYSTRIVSTGDKKVCWTIHCHWGLLETSAFLAPLAALKDIFRCDVAHALHYSWRGSQTARDNNSTTTTTTTTTRFVLPCRSRRNL